MPEIILETGRLILRTEAPGDLAFWLEHINIPLVLRHLGGPREPHAMEAARAIFEHGFTRLGMDKIYGQTSDSNIASWRMMERLGMRRRHDLDYVDPDYPPQDNPTIIFEIAKATL